MISVQSAPSPLPPKTRTQKKQKNKKKKRKKEKDTEIMRFPSVMLCHVLGREYGEARTRIIRLKITLCSLLQ